MKRMKAVILSLAVLVTLSGLAAARDWDDHDRDDHGRNGYRAGYDKGYQDGRHAGWDDRKDHRSYSPGKIDDDRGYEKGEGARGQYKKGYREGYHKGYEEAYRGGRDGDRDRDRDGDRDRDRDSDRDRDRDGDRDRDRDRNWQGQNNNDVAYRTGYQDGLTVGRQDKQGGHSYRPHSHDQSYGNADHNYSQVGGDKNAYKLRYRQGFDDGYNRGYKGR